MYWLRNLIKFNNLFKAGQKILDFGCGGGYMLKNIKEKNTLLHGVEVNKEAKKIAEGVRKASMDEKNAAKKDD